MRLYFTPTSPFVRKVLVAARELGVEGRLETVFLRPAPTKADPELSRANPLSKIPALILDDETALFDSPVICEYLETLAPGRRLVPAGGPERFQVLRTQALADGILDAAVLVFYETTQRPRELHFEPWLSGQREKANQGLDELERVVERFGADVDLGQISVAVTVGWLNFRSVLGDVMTTRPKLAKFCETFRARPSMQATEPPPA